MNFRPLLAGAVMFALATCVHAESLYFGFSATITYSDGSLAGVKEGNHFTGRLAYDPLNAYGYDFPGFAYYFLGRGSSFSAQIGNNFLYSNERVGASVINNYGREFGDAFVLDAAPLLINGTVLEGGYWGFQLASLPSSTDVLTSTALPHTFDLAAFDGGDALNYGYLHTNGGHTKVLNYRIDSITSTVPEPETYSLLLGGIALLVARQRIRKQA